MFFKKKSLIYDNLLKKRFRTKQHKLARFSIILIVSIFLHSYRVSKISLFRKKNFKYLFLTNKKY